MMTREMEKYEGFRRQLTNSPIVVAVVSVAMIGSALALLEILL
jgi:hypothetical protein